MKKLSLSGIALMVLISAVTFGQTPTIHPKHVQEKNKFSTRVLLINGEKFSGDLVGCTDTSIILSIYRSVQEGHFYWNNEFSYRELDYVILKRKSKNIATAVFVPTFFFVGMGVVGIADAFTRTTVKVVSLGTDEAAKAGPGAFLAGAAIGAAVGAIIGTAIDQGSRKRYILKIHGKQNAFTSYLPSLESMVIQKE